MGGAGKQLTLTAGGLAHKGHTVGIYTYMGNTMEHSIDSLISYYPETRPPKSKIFEYLLTPYHIHKILTKIKPDVAISWRANAGCFLVLGAIGTKIKTIFSERNDPYMERNLFLEVAKVVCGFSNGGVFQTEMVRNFYKRLSSKSVVIPNSIAFDKEQVDEILPFNQRKKEIAWIGRIYNVQKRLDIALKAMQIINREMPQYKLAIYGDGNDLNTIKEWIVEFNLSDCVELKGRIKNPVAVLRESRMLLFSSDYEGIPNVILESFLAGTPVAATDCSPGGVRVLIESGTNGYVVPIRDYESLACKAISILSDEVKSMQYAIEGRKRLMCFSESLIFAKWDEYIKGRVVHE